MPIATLGRMSRAWVVGKYALFQIPGLVLLGFALLGAVRWLDMSHPVAWGILVFWLLKDVAMFPFVRVAYESASTGGAHALVGARGIAKQVLSPRGYVQVGSESWKAEVAREHAPLPEGAAVRVLSVQGLTLLVEPESSGP